MPVTKSQQRAYARKLDEITRRFDRFEASTIRQSLRLLKNLRSNIAGQLTEREDFTQFRLRELQQNIDFLIRQYQAQLTIAMNGGIQQAYEMGGRYATEPLQSLGLSEVFFRPSMAQINTLTSFSADLIQGIGDTTRRAINTQIRVAALGEKSTFQAMKDITAVLGIPPRATAPARGIAYEAERIFRTEMNRSFSLSNHTQQQAQKELIPGLQKKWVATADTRTRLSHLSAHGQLVAIDKPFTVGGEKLDYPLDPNGSAKNTIHCRCRSVTIVPEFGDIKTPLDEQIEAEKERRLAEKPIARPVKAVVDKKIPDVNRKQYQGFSASDRAGERNIENWEMDSSYVAWEKGLSATEREWLSHYKQEGYEWMNPALRGNIEVLEDWDLTRADLDSVTRSMDGALRGHRLPNDITAWRGGARPDLDALLDSGRDIGDLRGMVISDDAYVSTSLNRGATDDFLKWAGDKPYRFEIQMPRGTYGAYIEGMDRNLQEYEFLLARGTKMEILDASMDGDVRNIVVRVLG